MRVLITGICGFVGFNVAKYFHERGHEVIGIDYVIRTMLENNLNELHKLGIKVYEEDIYNEIGVDSVINKHRPEAIIHLAGQTTVTDSLVNPEFDFNTNVVGTFNILESVRTTTYEKYPKIIFASTNKVYGSNVIYNPVDEVVSVDQCHHSPYGVSKLSADLYVQEYCFTFGIPAAIFRMSCIYGPHQFGHEGQGWVSHFIISAVMDKVINIYGDGEQQRDLLYVEDLAEAYHKYLVEYNGEIGMPLVFNIGGGDAKTITLNQLIEYLSQELDKNIRVKYHKKPRQADQKVYISDIDYVGNELGWEPKTQIDVGLRNTIHWVECNRDLWMQ